MSFLLAGLGFGFAFSSPALALADGFLGRLAVEAGGIGGTSVSASESGSTKSRKLSDSFLDSAMKVPHNMKGYIDREFAHQTLPVFAPYTFDWAFSNTPQRSLESALAVEQEIQPRTQESP